MAWVSRGFTLIELLIALFITAVVGAMSYAGLDAAIKSLEGQERQQQYLNDLNVLFAVMNKDFRQIVSRPIRDERGDQEPALYLTDESGIPVLKFTRAGWRNPRPEAMPRSELQRVEYRLEDNKLIRKSWYVLDRANDEAFVDSILLEGVDELRFEFLDNSLTQAANGQVQGGLQVQSEKASLGGEWQETWPFPAPQAGSPVSETLPVAIAVIVNIKGWGEVRRLYELPKGP